MGTLCKDQLAEKLVGLFAETDPGNIDEAVAQAKDLLSRGAKQAKWNDLERLFDTQIATLKDRGVPKFIVGMLWDQKGFVLARASTMSFENGHVPFLPVIPRTYLSIYSQMPMVKSGDKAGYTNLKPTAITDVVATPENPYYIYDVEDGEAMRGKTPQDAEKLIKKEGRLGLTEVEVIALGVHTDVLSKHYVEAVGSRYVSGGVPFLLRLGGDEPGLDWTSLDYGDDHWGAASCGSR
ncbi:MAG: DUF5701 family protein [bacterium]|nr:DUF5701 family protein [bacterium]